MSTWVYCVYLLLLCVEYRVQLGLSFASLDRLNECSLRFSAIVPSPRGRAFGLHSPAHFPRLACTGPTAGVCTATHVATEVREKRTVPHGFRARTSTSARFAVTAQSVQSDP